MRTGLVLYCQNLAGMMTFYQQVFDFDLIDQDSDYARLLCGDYELVLLVSEQSQRFHGSATDPREQTALKPSFFVTETLPRIKEKIIAHQGDLFAPKSWLFDGRQVCDGCDCEGNIFQLRIETTNQDSE